MTGKFFLRTDRNPDKNGKYAIYLDYVLGTKHARTDTEVWIEERYWDADKREISRKHPQYPRLTNQLQKKRQVIDDAIDLCCFNFINTCNIVVDVEAKE